MDATAQTMFPQRSNLESEDSSPGDADERGKDPSDQKSTIFVL